MPRSAFDGILTALLIVGLVLVAWQLAYVLLLAFGGLLLAVFLRHMAVALARHPPLPTGGALAVVVLGLAAAAILLVVLVGPRILAQLELLWQSLPAALDQVEQTLRQREWGRFLLERVSDGGERPRWNILGAIGGTVSTVVAVVSNVMVLLTVAIFLAIDPDLYRRGLVRLVPLDKRVRALEVLDALGDALWRWLLGQFAAMLVVALFTAAGLWLIGIPLALALGLIAGLVNFIPYLGPFISAAPAVLIAFAQSPTDALYTVLLFVLIQQVEGNILMPVIQKRATSLPPVLTILAVVGFGVLFGTLGVLFATPLLLVAIVLVRMLYVEDMLGDREVARSERPVSNAPVPQRSRAP
jgi:predicted PurR-regulated permease PerM